MNKVAFFFFGCVIFECLDSIDLLDYSNLESNVLSSFTCLLSGFVLSCIMKRKLLVYILCASRKSYSFAVYLWSYFI